MHALPIIWKRTRSACWRGRNCERARYEGRRLGVHEELLHHPRGAPKAAPRVDQDSRRASRAVVVVAVETMHD